MFRGMRLGTRLALGFGTLVVIAGALGVAGYVGLSRSYAVGQVGNAAQDCVAHLLNARREEKNFQLRGFARYGQDTESSDQKWGDSFARLDGRLRELSDSPELRQDERELVSEARRSSEQYAAAFALLAAARRQKDESLAKWTQAGRGLTNPVNQAVDEAVNPRLAAARQSKDFDMLTLWTDRSLALDRKVVQPLLLLRVSAVYLIATNADEQWNAYGKQFAVVRAGLAEWVQLARQDDKLNACTRQLEQGLNEYASHGEAYHAAILVTREADARLVDKARKIGDNCERLREALQSRTVSLTRFIKGLSLSLAGAAMLLGLVLAVVIGRGITVSIRRISATLGDGARQVSEASACIAGGAQHLAAGASQQAASLEETSSALEEMSAATTTNAEHARQASELSRQARDAADQGSHTLVRLNEAMTAINVNSTRISKIIKVIEEIAFQTNLLALNAAVEAARAGEHGKGFAVVAEEVRNLAQRAAAAAQETNGLIEGAVNSARGGTEVAAEAGKVLQAVGENVGRVSQLVDEIAGASREQARGVEQLNTAVSQIDKVTQQTASAAEESASAAEQLAAQAQSVNGLVDELAALIEKRESRPAVSKP